MQKIDYLTKRSSELLADMRRLEKENQKNKRRGDTLQKERDNSRSELSKTNGLKEKLEKLCRELQRDNNKMKVGDDSRRVNMGWTLMSGSDRTRTRNCRQPKSVTARPGMKSTPMFSLSWRAYKRTRILRRNRWWTCRWTSCRMPGFWLLSWTLFFANLGTASNRDSSPSSISTSCANYTSIL